MLRHFIRLAVWLFLPFLWGIPLLYGAAQNYRACQAEDLAGEWLMAAQASPAPPPSQNAFYYPYQRYVFTPSGEMKHLTSTQPISEEQREIQTMTPAVSTYQINPGGTLTIRRKDSSQTQVVLCTAITDPPQDPVEKNPRRGDLLLSYFQKKDSPPVVQRLLRRDPASTVLKASSANAGKSFPSAATPAAKKSASTRQSPISN